MRPPTILLIASGLGAATLALLWLRGLIGPRQVALGLGGTLLGAAIGAAWAGGGHG